MIGPSELRAVQLVAQQVLKRRRYDSEDREPQNGALKAQKDQFAATIPNGAQVTPQHLNPANYTQVQNALGRQTMSPSANSTQVLNTLSPQQRLEAQANEALNLKQQQGAEISGNRPLLAQARGV